MERMSATMKAQGKDEYIRLLEDQMGEAKRMIVGLREKEEGFHKTLFYMKKLRQREEVYLQEIANQEKAINAFAAAFIHTDMQRQHWNALKSELKAIEDHETHLGVHTVSNKLRPTITTMDSRFSKIEIEKAESNMELQRVLEENRNLRSELDAINSRIERVWKHIPPSQHGDESNESKQILSPNQSKQINIERVLMESRHSLHYLEHRISQKEAQIESSNNENRDDQRASTVSERELTESIKSQLEMVQNEMNIMIKQQNDEAILLKKSVQDLQQKLSHKDQEMEKLQEMIKEKEHVTKEAEEERDVLFREIRNRDAEILKLQAMLKKKNGKSTVKRKPGVKRKRKVSSKVVAKTKKELSPQTGDGVDENLQADSASESMLQRAETVDQQMMQYQQKEKEHLKAIANQEKTISAMAIALEHSKMERTQLNALKTALKANRNRETTETEVKVNENRGSVEVVSLQYEAPQQLLAEEENKEDNTTSDLVDLKIEEELDIEGHEEHLHWNITRKSIRTNHRRSTEICIWKLNLMESAEPLPEATEMSVNLTDDIRLQRERKREMEYQNAVKAVHRLSSGIVSMGQEMERMERQCSMQSDHLHSRHSEPIDNVTKSNGSVEIICKETENDLDTVKEDKSTPITHSMDNEKMNQRTKVEASELKRDLTRITDAHNERGQLLTKTTAELKAERNKTVALKKRMLKLRTKLSNAGIEHRAVVEEKESEINRVNAALKKSNDRFQRQSARSQKKPTNSTKRKLAAKKAAELQSARNEIIAQRAELEKVKVALNRKGEESQALQLRTDDAERSITNLRRLITAKDVDIEAATNRVEDQRAVIRKVHSEMVVLRETLIAVKRESMVEIQKKSKAKMATLIAERNVLRRKSRKSEDAEKEIVRLKEALKDHDAVVEKQRSEIKKLRAKKKGEREALTHGIKKRNSEISNLRNELDTKNEMLHALQVQMVETNTESDTLEKEMDRLHAVNQKKATKLEMDQSNTISKSKDVSNSGMHSYQGKEDEYRKQIVELQQQIENQQKAINAMSKALENRQMESHQKVAAQQDVDGVKPMENTPSEDSVHIKDGLLRRGLKGHDSKSAKNQLKTSWEENRRETLDLRAMLREKDREIEAKDIDIESATKRVENQRAVIRKVHSEMYVLKETLIAAKREQMATKPEAENKVKMEKVSKAKIAKLVAQRNVLRKRLKENKDAKKDIIELREALKHQDAVVEKQESEIKQLKVNKKSERRSLANGIKKKDSEISKLHNELDTKNEMNRVLQGQMEEANTRIDGLRKEMDRLHEALNQEKANKLEAEHLISFQDEYKVQIAGLKQQIENQSKAMSAMEQEILTKAMDSYSDEIKEIIEDLNSMIENKDIELINKSHELEFMRKMLMEKSVELDDFRKNAQDKANTDGQAFGNLPHSKNKAIQQMENELERLKSKLNQKGAQMELLRQKVASADCERLTEENISNVEQKQSIVSSNTASTMPLFIEEMEEKEERMEMQKPRIPRAEAAVYEVQESQDELHSGSGIEVAESATSPKSKVVSMMQLHSFQRTDDKQQTEAVQKNVDGMKPVDKQPIEGSIQTKDRLLDAVKGNLDRSSLFHATKVDRMDNEQPVVFVAQANTEVQRLKEHDPNLAIDQLKLSLEQKRRETLELRAMLREKDGELESVYRELEGFHLRKNSKNGMRINCVEKRTVDIDGSTAAVDERRTSLSELFEKQKDEELKSLKQNVVESESDAYADGVLQRESRIVMSFDSMEKEIKEKSCILKLRIDDAEREIAELRRVIQAKNIDIASAADQIEDQRLVIKEVHLGMLVLRETLIAAEKESTMKIRRQSVKRLETWNAMAMLLEEERLKSSAMIDVKNHALHDQMVEANRKMEELQEQHDQQLQRLNVAVAEKEEALKVLKQETSKREEQFAGYRLSVQEMVQETILLEDVETNADNDSVSNDEEKGLDRRSIFFDSMEKGEKIYLLNIQIGEMEQLHEKQQDMIKQREQDNERLREENHNVREEIHRIQQTLTEMRGHPDTIQSDRLLEVEEHAAEIKQMTAELDSRQNQIDSLSETVSIGEDTVRHRDAIAEALIEVIDAKDVHLQRLETTIHQKEHEMGSLNHFVASLCGGGAEDLTADRVRRIQINSSLVAQQSITGQQRYRTFGLLLMLCIVGVLIFLATQHNFEYLKERIFGLQVLIGQEHIDSSWTFVLGATGFGMMLSFLSFVAVSYL